MKIQHRIDLEVFGLQSRFTNWKQMQSILQFLFIWLVIDSVYFPNEHVKNTHEIYMEIALFIRINWAIIQWPIKCYKIFPMLCDLSYVKQIRTRCSIPPNRIYPLKKKCHNVLAVYVVLLPSRSPAWFCSANFVCVKNRRRSNSDSIIFSSHWCNYAGEL